MSDFKERIQEIEELLKGNKICSDSECGCCGEFHYLNDCGSSLRTHRHCEKCFTVICLKCNCKLCNKCNQS